MRLLASPSGSAANSNVSSIVSRFVNAAASGALAAATGATAATVGGTTIPVGASSLLLPSFGFV
jgi:hypothetical protein